MVTMADAPTIPGTSKKPMTSKQKLLLGGGVAVGGVIGLWWYEKQKSSATSATGTTTANQGIDPNTGVPYADEEIDPATGIPYADEGAQGVTPGELGTYNPLTGQYTPGYETAPTVTGTNAEWATAAETQLVADGFDPATVATALGLYLAGQPLSSDQYGIVQAALAMEGQPPHRQRPATR